MILDETMAHACIGSKINGVTAELTIRFKKALPVGTEVFVSAEVTERKSRILLTVGEIADSEGTVYATGKARFIGTG